MATELKTPLTDELLEVIFEIPVGSTIEDAETEPEVHVELPSDEEEFAAPPADES